MANTVGTLELSGPWLGWEQDWSQVVRRAAWSRRVGQEWLHHGQHLVTKLAQLLRAGPDGALAVGNRVGGGVGAPPSAPGCPTVVLSATRPLQRGSDPQTLGAHQRRWAESLSNGRFERVDSSHFRPSNPEKLPRTSVSSSITLTGPMGAASAETEQRLTVSHHVAGADDRCAALKANSVSAASSTDTSDRSTCLPVRATATWWQSA